MKDNLIFEGKTYISAKQAAKIMSYAQDYVGQLCRLGKLDCRMIGRSWFVTQESLISHRESMVQSVAERSSKALVETSSLPKVENILTVTSATIAPVVTTPVSVSTAPVSVSVTPLLKYEAGSAPLLPEIAKKVPSSFSLPSTIFVSAFPNSLSNSSSASAIPTSHRITNNVIATFLIATVIVSGGYIFNTTHNNVFAKIGSSAFGRALSFLVPAHTTNYPSNETVNSAAVAQTSPSASPVRGIAISPSSGTANGDEAMKANLLSSFSDEVSVSPDQSGTAGVITPVFKKTKGDNFVYVLVPVKDKDAVKDNSTVTQK